MKAVICQDFGPREGLQLMEVDPPIVGKGEVLIDIHSCGLNFFDGLMVEGKYQTRPDRPFTPGSEVAGTIAALGEGVTDFAIGDRVLALVGTGGYGEQAKVDASRVLTIPDDMDFDAAAGFLITYATSHHALKDRAGLKPGETVLVLGAAGGVGLPAIEIAKRMGAKVIAAASSDEKLALCKAYGADELINYASEDLRQRLKDLTEGRGVDVVYDPVGGDYSETAIRALALNGRFLVIGFAAGNIPKIALNLLLLKQSSLIGVFWGAFSRANPKAHATNMAELFSWFSAGDLRPHISGTYSLPDFAKALDDVMERRAKGKIILRIKEDASLKEKLQ